jgi:diadenosine tetraphosphate (Ap4A) HIT family hydrolase
MYTESVPKVTSDCLFCQVVALIPDNLRWHDRPLVRIPGIGAVIPGLGAFVPGYVLVFPEQHVESTLRVARKIRPAFDDMVSRTAQAVTEIFGPTTIFEHGSCSQPDTRRSACLDHAHIHILPGLYGLTKLVTEPIGCSHDHPGSARTADAGYLLLHEPPHGPRYGIDPGISQYLRRCIATKLGVPDEWDYLLFPRMANVEQTVRVLSGRIATVSVADSSLT